MSERHKKLLLEMAQKPRSTRLCFFINIRTWKRARFLYIQQGWQSKYRQNNMWKFKLHHIINQLMQVYKMNKLLLIILLLFSSCSSSVIQKKQQITHKPHQAHQTIDSNQTILGVNQSDVNIFNPNYFSPVQVFLVILFIILLLCFISLSPYILKFIKKKRSWLCFDIVI